MINLTEIVSAINAQFTAALPFQDVIQDKNQCRIYGVASLYQESQQTEQGPIAITKPVILTDSGYQYAGIDDVYRFIVYHRALSIGINQSNTPAYGDRLPDTRHAIKMAMFVFCSVTCVPHAVDLSAMITAGMPGLLEGDTRPKGIKKLLITLNEFTLNETQVLREEYAAAADKYSLKPGQQILKVLYTIESTIDKKCFNNCS